MEVGVELEDDLFFADLSKQISLLIMDDDDGDDPLLRYPSVSLQGENHRTAQFPYLQEEMLRRESKGTGVFIPKSSQQSRRKHRQGRLSSKSSRQTHDDSTTMASQAAFNNFFSPKERLKSI